MHGDTEDVLAIDTGGRADRFRSSATDDVRLAAARVLPGLLPVMVGPWR